jgi:hypothetical protein
LEALTDSVSGFDNFIENLINSVLIEFGQGQGKKPLLIERLLRDMAF